MEKPINLMIIDTKQEIVSKLSQFPIEISKMIVNEIKQIVEANATMITAEERRKYQESLIKKEENL